jgi:hypothetical protein
VRERIDVDRSGRREVLGDARPLPVAPPRGPRVPGIADEHEEARLGQDRLDGVRSLWVRELVSPVGDGGVVGEPRVEVGQQRGRVPADQGRERVDMFGGHDAAHVGLLVEQVVEPLALGCARVAREEVQRVDDASLVRQADLWVRLEDLPEPRRTAARRAQDEEGLVHRMKIARNGCCDRQTPMTRPAQADINRIVPPCWCGRAS